MDKEPSNIVTIAKFFGLKGATAVKELKELNDDEKNQLAEGIRNGSLTY